ERVLLDEAALQEPGDEGAGAGEGVENVYALAAQRLAELLAQEVVDAVEDEVDDLDRRVDDAEALGHLGERVAEELVVELDDDLLLARGAVDVRGAQLHRVVERLERARFLVEV